MSDLLESSINSTNAKLIDLEVKLNKVIAIQSWMTPLYPFDGCQQSTERWENLRYEIASIRSTIRQISEYLAKEKAKILPFAISAVEAAEVVWHPGLANIVAEYL